jgi:hypothetical protein
VARVDQLTKAGTFPGDISSAYRKNIRLPYPKDISISNSNNSKYNAAYVRELPSSSHEEAPNIVPVALHQNLMSMLTIRIEKVYGVMLRIPRGIVISDRDSRKEI